MKALEWIRLMLTVGSEVAGMVMESRKNGDDRPTDVVVADMTARLEAGRKRREEADRKARERIGRRS